MGTEKYAIFFENGAWILLKQDTYGNVFLREACPSLEEAIMAALRKIIRIEPTPIKVTTSQALKDLGKR